jgi:predicted permease
MGIFTTIIPIFAIIGLGAVVRLRGYIPETFLGPANRLVYYLAIPAMIFRAVSRANLGVEINPTVISVTLGIVTLGFIMGWLVSPAVCRAEKRQGTFIQSCFHGNLGYIALAVIFYLMGENGLVKGSIIAGVVMILQNFLAVLILQLKSSQPEKRFQIWPFIKRLAANPVIIAAVAGMAYSLSGLPIPLIVDRSLSILSGMALPTALLLIGASLSFNLLRDKLLSLFLVCLIKIGLMPALGLMAYQTAGLKPSEYLPALIILAAPTATLTYIMANEMGGDADFAVAAVSFCTVISGLTYLCWLNVA